MFMLYSDFLGEAVRTAPLCGPAERRLQRAAHLLDRDHAAQHALAVDGHQRPEAPERSPRTDSSVIGRSSLHAPAAVLLRARAPPRRSASPRRGPAAASSALLAGDAEEAAGVVDHREPRPAVAQEVLVERLGHRRLATGSPRAGVSMMSATRTPDPRAQRRLDERRRGPTGTSRNAIAISHSPLKLRYASMQPHADAGQQQPRSPGRASPRSGCRAASRR